MLTPSAYPAIPGWGWQRRAVTSTTTVVATDRGYTIDATSGTYDIALTAAATLGAGFSFGVYNSGSGVVTINPDGAETIRSPAGSAATLALSQGQGVLVMCDGTGFDVVANATIPTSGTNTGDVTLAAVGAVPNANGASLAGQVLNLQPADGSNPGVVTTGAQTIAGAKTLSGVTTISNGTAASSPTVAALTVVGGIGTQNNLFVGDGTGLKRMVFAGGNSGGGNGASLTIRNASADIMILGNKSAPLGSAYDATPYVYTESPIEFAYTILGAASTTARSTLRIPHGTAPSSPVDGDMWTTTAGLYVRINGATVGPLS